MRNLRGTRGGRRLVRLGAPDASLTGSAGLVVVAELVERLGVVAEIDAGVGPIKRRRRGAGAGGLLVGMAQAQMLGEGFLVGLDRGRADPAGQALAAVRTPASTTAAGLARRMDAGHFHGVEAAVAAVLARAVPLLPVGLRTRLATSPPTIDIDATEIEVYGRKKQRVAYNYLGQRSGRAHLGTWAELGVVVAADLIAGDEDPRRDAVALLHRALLALPSSLTAAGDSTSGAGVRPRLRADAGYFDGTLAAAADAAGVDFALGVRRNPAVWRALAAVPETAWTDCVDMPGAQVAVCDYRPAGWPATTRCLVRRVTVTADSISTDPRARRRRTLIPGQVELALTKRSPPCTPAPSSSPASTSAPPPQPRRSSTGTATAPTSRTGSATPSTGPRYATCPQATTTSTSPGPGRGCSRSTSARSCNTSPA